MPFNHALLKAWRQQNHLTRKEVAAHLCVSHTYYVKLENGERRPSLEIFESISRLTGIDAESLLGSGNAAVGAVDFSPAILQKEAVELRRQLLESDAALFRKDQTIQELMGIQGIREKLLSGFRERDEAEYRKVLLSTGALYRFDDPAKMPFQVSADASLNDEAYIYRKHKNEDRIFRPDFFDRFT